ncbi:hypothetical protein GGR50DRAFT_692381 [Xylaria sp. CBS 124048]|nr:hypothetical protein GGR50DRAFT_692381 [Xylaria sp. CBS 124048]
MPSDEPEKGDKVSWNWGSGAPSGTVAETKHEGQIAIQSKRGNTIKKNASAENPAVRVERTGNDVVKRASELTVTEKKNDDDDDDGGGGGGGSGSGEKRKADTQDEPESDEEEEEKKEDEDAENPHVINKQGKEVRRSGKESNKKQKKHRDEDDDVKGERKAGDRRNDDKEDEKEDAAGTQGEKNAKKHDHGKKHAKAKGNHAGLLRKYKTGTGRNTASSRASQDLVSGRTRSHQKAAAT